MKGRRQQRLTEATWTAEEEILAVFMRQIIYILRFVNIQVAVIDNLRERLYSYGISVFSHNAHSNNYVGKFKYIFLKIRG